MTEYLIAMRSLTYAQRGQKALDRAGVRSLLMKTPASLSPKGCSHSLKVGETYFNAAMTVLKRNGLSPIKFFISPGGSDWREI